ncbi:MAG: ribbon-helix-helix domain-containing protein [Leptolyngbya sp. Prado105]|jgi:metal-responsive CopG/Arc/MetJ family transcriptional regulator|nr:ribbon-helix-helix domain-containing protein [Leptolyngbya sp. Prado105]
MHTLTRTSTTEMEVTSIRLERELKEELKALSGNQGYQALIRDILWNYVQQRSSSYSPSLSSADVRATLSATAQNDDRCALTGKPIHSGENILLGLTIEGNLIPLSLGSLP